MKYLLIVILLFSSCNVAKKVFRHKETSVIQVKKDSTGTTDTHVDTSRQSSVRVIESTDIVKPGINKKGNAELDLDLLKEAARKGKPLITVLLDSAGNLMGTIANSLDTVNNRLSQLANLVIPSTEEHHKKESNQNDQQNGITNQHQQATLNENKKQVNNNQEVTKDVKRSPAWIKIAMAIAGAVLILLAIFKRGKIWKWFKSKLIKK